MLVFFSWTSVEAVWLYLKLVKILGIERYVSHYTLKSGLLAWSIPLIIVIICASISNKNYIYDREELFFCRATMWPFIFGFIVPFLILYLFNWIIFISIMISIFNHMKHKGTERFSRIKAYKNNLFIAMSLAVVLGLGWGFGLLTTSSTSITRTFQILFSIFVGAQGILLFLLHGLRNSDARKVWKNCLTSCRCKIAYSFKKPAASMTRNLLPTESSGNTFMKMNPMKDLSPNVSSDKSETLSTGKENEMATISPNSTLKKTG